MALQGFVPSAAAGKCQQNILVSLSRRPQKIRFTNWVGSSSRSTLQPKACLSSTETKEITRPSSNFPPTVWGDTFLDSVPLPSSETKANDMLIGELKQKVKEMFMKSKDDPVENVCFIDLLCRLGVSYHFEAEIEQQLDQFFQENHNILDGANDYDLYTVSLIFQLLRLHGHKISCDVFNKFKDKGSGKFKENLKSDARGMLSLYDASQLRVQDEDILEEALDFTTTHLKSSSCEFHLAKHISDALRQPQHKGIPRMEARRYITFYEEEESRNETLLMFAKLDFNRLQLLYREELSELTSWWNNLRSRLKLSYSRDILVEMHMISVAFFYEPCYSDSRVALTKFGKILVIIDDTFDSYGTFDELQCFTDAVQRWDISAVDELPDYMKNIYSALLDFFEELDDQMSKEARSYRVSFAKEAMKEMVRAYFVETQWRNEGTIPPFDEYLNIANLAIGYVPYTAVAFVGMGEVAGRNEFEWLKTKPRIFRDVYKIARLMDDTANHEREQRREDFASGIQCYMNEYGVSEEGSVEAIRALIQNTWKDLNEEIFMMPTKDVIPFKLLIFALNNARAAHVFYNHGNDGFSHPNHVSGFINHLFVDEIPI